MRSGESPLPGPASSFDSARGKFAASVGRVFEPDSTALRTSL